MACSRDSWGLSVRRADQAPKSRRRFDATKRAVDVTASAIGLVLTAPVQAATAAAVLAAHGRPVLFRQPRPGRDGEVFELVKFRTMRHPDATHVTDAERLKSLGRFLRSTSLDELPTLWNVLKGDMSLVGPRPLLVEYLPRYSPEQARRHEVRPGITGLAQVSGRNALSWEEKFALDVEYVDRRCFRLDLLILWWTVRSVLARHGISADGQATMTPFLGMVAESEGAA
jgi:lipopolysaccharide/colanic/teichoic acid biosynthesis glycosyltransferase